MRMDALAQVKMTTPSERQIPDIYSTNSGAWTVLYSQVPEARDSISGLTCSSTWNLCPEEGKKFAELP